ncbi:MAG: cell division protein FtsA [Acidobacteria bacterium]|nr:cell division protein FtsA [Acidobacteriota bacterium]
MKKSPIICGLDVGTSKICMVTVRRHPDGGLELISFGRAESRGLNKGAVVNLDEAADAIRNAAAQAEKKAGISVDAVRLGAGGDHFQSFNSRGAVTVTGERQEVTPELAAQVIAASQSLVIPHDREIKHVLTQEFFLDGQGGIKNPAGLFGSQLDVTVHIITCRSSLIQNLINAVNHAEMRVQKVIAQPLAAAEAVLTEDEKELGVAVIDIGGGSTSIAVLQHSSVRFTKILPVGGRSFTRDLAIGLQTPLEDAERIKRSSGTVSVKRTDAEDPVAVPGMGTRSSRTVTRKTVCDILRARAMELLELIGGQLRAATEGSTLVAGAVITGGGSMLDGITELAEEILNMPARQGFPMGIRGLSDELLHPEYATAVGLTLFDAENSMVGPPPGVVQRFVGKVLSWMEK